jgi:DNA-binding NarL/FixJ family response regulator
MELHRNPTIVIMDYFLNSQYEQANNGLEIIKRIKVQKPETNIIVLSAQEDFQVVIDALKQYDCIYVQKNEDAFKKVKQFIHVIFKRKNLRTF